MIRECNIFRNMFFVWHNKISMKNKYYLYRQTGIHNRGKTLMVDRYTKS